MSLSLGARSKADAGDAVAAHDGYAVGGEGPFVSQGPVDPGWSRLFISQALVAVESFIGCLQSLWSLYGLLG